MHMSVVHGPVVDLADQILHAVTNDQDR